FLPVLTQWSLSFPHPSQKLDLPGDLGRQWQLQTESRDTRTGDVCVLFGLHARDAHRAHDLPFGYYRHTAFQHAFHERSREKRQPTAIDDVFIALGFTTANRRSVRLARRDMRRDRRRTTHAQHAQQVAAL